LINVLIVASKPWSANSYKLNVDDIEGFKVLGITDNINVVEEFLKKNKVNLIILDVKDNLQFMKELKNLKITANVILLSSFARMKNLDSYLKLGMVDYLIKPFQDKDFKNILQNYLQKSWDINSYPIKDYLHLTVNLNKRTLDRINEFMRVNKRFLTTAEIGEHLKLSINTIRKYLRYLYLIGEITKKIYQQNSGKTLFYYKHIAD